MQRSLHILWDIPELVFYISPFLDKSQLAAASAVCKSWNTAFIPFLYSDFIHCPNDKLLGPSDETIHANALHVRSITFGSSPSKTFPWPSITHLLKLTVDCLFTGNWSQMSDFITRNPQLRAVSMHATIGMSTPAVEILDALSKCQHLRTLSINFDNMNTKVARYLYMACNRLETLVLSIRAAKYLDLSSISIDIPSVKNLHFMVTRRMSFNDQLDVIQGFSQLNFLHWEFEFDYIQSRDVDKSPSKRRLSAKELDLFGFNWYNPDGSADVPVAKVLDYCEQVKSFKTTCLNIGPLTFQSLERHFGSLTCLLFDRCNFITSGMVQGFMASCPHLTHLKSRTLDVHDICGEIMGEQDDTLLYPKEWICLKLVRLSVPICGFYGKPVEWQRQVLQRLATLEELKYLEIGSYGIDLTNSFYYDGLDLRLGCRLKILGSLKRLKGIMFVGLKQRLEEQDIRWMLKNLSGLKYLIGTANYDMEKHMHLEMILKGTRISLVSVGGSEYGEAEYLKTNEDMWKDIESDLV